VKIDIDLLKKLEKLSHLNVAPEKQEEIVSQLSDILEYVENLSQLDTSTIDSYFSTIEGGTLLRDDIEKTRTEVSQSILKNAPLQEDDFFIVPAIIE